jgi:hypothetical protein
MEAAIVDAAAAVARDGARILAATRVRPESAAHNDGVEAVAAAPVFDTATAQVLAGATAAARTTGNPRRAMALATAAVAHVERQQRLAAVAVDAGSVAAANALNAYNLNGLNQTTNVGGSPTHGGGGHRTPARSSPGSLPPYPQHHGVGAVGVGATACGTPTMWRRIRAGPSPSGRAGNAGDNYVTDFDSPEAQLAAGLLLAVASSAPTPAAASDSNRTLGVPSGSGAGAAADGNTAAATNDAAYAAYPFQPPLAERERGVALVAQRIVTVQHQSVEARRAGLAELRAASRRAAALAVATSAAAGAGSTTQTAHIRDAATGFAVGGDGAAASCTSWTVATVAPFPANATQKGIRGGISVFGHTEESIDKMEEDMSPPHVFMLAPSETVMAD